MVEVRKTQKVWLGRDTSTILEDDSFQGVCILLKKGDKWKKERRYNTEDEVVKRTTLLKKDDIELLMSNNIYKYLQETKVFVERSDNVRED